MQTKLFGKRLLLFSSLCKRHIRNQSLSLNDISSASKPQPFLPMQLFWRREVGFLEEVNYPPVKQWLDGTETHRLAKHTKPHFDNPAICSSSCFPCCHLKYFKSSKVQQEEKVRKQFALECSKPAFFSEDMSIGSSCK